MKILYKSALLTYHARNALLKAEDRLDAYLLSVARQQNWIRKGGRGNCPAVESLGCVEAWFKVAAHIRQGAREQQQATYPSLMQFSSYYYPKRPGALSLKDLPSPPTFRSWLLSLDFLRAIFCNICIFETIWLLTNPKADFTSQDSHYTLFWLSKTWVK